MFAQHNTLGIIIDGCFKGYAEGPLGIGALLIILVVVIWRSNR
jgi:hypothetical protein